MAVVSKVQLTSSSVELPTGHPLGKLRVYSIARGPSESIAAHKRQTRTPVAPQTGLIESEQYQGTFSLFPTSDEGNPTLTIQRTLRLPRLPRGDCLAGLKARAVFNQSRS